jgi:uncharacterized protein (TIGR04222 family)
VGTGAPPDHTLTAPQLGALAGGTDQAVAASVAGLVESGRLRVDDDRRICAVVTDGRPRPEDDPGLSDLDVAVLRSAGSPREIRAVVSDDGPFGLAEDFDDQLVARGLLRDPARMRARARLAWIPFGLVLLLGIARLAAGLGHGASISFLVIVLAVALFVAGTGAGRSRPGSTPGGCGRRRTHWRASGSGCSGGSSASSATPPGSRRRPTWARGCGTGSASTRAGPHRAPRRRAGVPRGSRRPAAPVAAPGRSAPDSRR